MTFPSNEFTVPALSLSNPSDPVRYCGSEKCLETSIKCSLKLEDQQFGQWIRAAQFNNSRKSVVEVAGFGEDAFIPSREASLLNNPRKFNQTLTGSVHWLVTGISLEKEKGGGS
ncbi:hypothetical protein CFP56_004605 [Quercus suber]|uniref:Uncharacterized protein n=1 Tax=Quercus suber TaxID=58331 RepID=A0AAW0LE54_QUESU